jgi:hypothetical protein
METTKILQSQKILRRNRYLITLLIVFLGFFGYFLINSAPVEARCPANPRDCPPGSQSTVGGGDPLTAPGIERCERDDIDNAQECKRDYRKCNRKDTQAKKVACKIQTIEDHKRSGGGGGGDPGGDPSGPLGLGEAGEFICGTNEEEDKNVHTKFDFGCLGTNYAQTGQGPKNISPILDLTYAVVRFLSIGVGIVIAISIIMSGIQYSMSEGNAEVTQKAKSRIRSAVLGLAIYIFVFAIAQFLVPGGVFKPGMWTNESILQLTAGPTIWK